MILYYINVQLLGGLYFEVNIFGVTLEIVQQGLALLALPIISLYNGERGYHKKWWQYFCYAFYPVHMLVLYLVFCCILCFIDETVLFSAGPGNRSFAG